MTPPFDAVDLAEIRRRPKEIRFCPSCGYRRLVAEALHQTCQVCRFSFVAFDADRLREVKTTERTDSVVSFEAFAILEIPAGRDGVEDLVARLLGTKVVEADGGRFEDV